MGNEVYMVVITNRYRNQHKRFIDMIHIALVKVKCNNTSLVYG